MFNRKRSVLFAALVVAVVVVQFKVQANPNLTPGVWKNITPPGVDFSQYLGGTCCITFDPSNPSTLYLGTEGYGVWKSNDGGATWFHPGDTGCTYADTTHYLGYPVRLAVDPQNSKHLYACDGVRQCDIGFWVSNDGGSTWVMPAGIVTASKTTTSDLTRWAIDPTDFNHILIGSHQNWSGLTNAGVIESFDGGKTVTLHQPIDSFTSASMGIAFLYNPALGLGNNRTWLCGNENNGLWRTTDAGANWTHVFTGYTAHGGNEIFYTKSGRIWSGMGQYPVYSDDNGVTWNMLPGSSNLPYGYYTAIIGDGSTLYSLRAEGGAFYCAPESSGLAWTAYNGGAQTFSAGANPFVYDPTNRIVYVALNGAGAWALRVIDPATGTHAGMARKNLNPMGTKNLLISVIGSQLVLSKELSGNKAIDIYDVKGERINPGNIARQSVIARERR